MSDVDFETIGQAVFAELNRRAADPQKARDLPGTHLMQLAASYQRYLEKKQELEERKMEGQEVDPMEMIDQPGLPLAMRIQILDNYCGELEKVWQDASRRIMALIEEAKAQEKQVEVFSDAALLP